MVHSKTSYTQIPESTKNQFIGAMKMSGKLWQSADLVGIKRSTASDIWQRYKKTGSAKNLQRSGHPPKLNDRGKRAVIREVLKDQKKPFTQVAKDAPSDISTTTVRRVAASEGYHRHVARKATFLTDSQKKKRLGWAEDFDGIDDQEWDNLCSSDECYIKLDDTNGRIYVTRRTDEEYDENCLVPKFKQSPVKVMIWACVMGGQGTIGCVGIPWPERGQNEHRSIYFPSPQCSPWPLLPPYGERKTRNCLSAGWCT